MIVINKYPNRAATGVQLCTGPRIPRREYRILTLMSAYQIASLKTTLIHIVLCI